VPTAVTEAVLRIMLGGVALDLDLSYALSGNPLNA
jgi:hypothetical protein